jgi:hypothetical protein
MLLERSGADVRLHQSIDGGKASHDLTNEVFISVPKGFRIKFAGETTVEVLNFESKKMSDLDDVRIAGYVTFRPPPATKFVSQELYDQVKKLMTAVDSATAALRFGTAALRDSSIEVHSVPFVQITDGSSGMNTFVAEGGRLSSKTNPVADSVRSIQGASSQDQSGFAYLEGTSLDSISKSLHEIARNSPPEAAVRTLLRFIHGDSDVWVVYAAIDALGDVPGESGRKALEGVRKNTRDPSLRAFVTRLLNER